MGLKKTKHHGFQKDLLLKMWKIVFVLINTSQIKYTVNWDYNKTKYGKYCIPHFLTIRVLHVNRWLNGVRWGLTGVRESQRKGALPLRLSPPISSGSAPSVLTQLGSVRSFQPAQALIRTLITENMPKD